MSTLVGPRELVHWEGYGFAEKPEEPSMKKTRHTTEQIIRILRDAEGEQLKTEEVCRKYSISAQTYYR